MFKKGEKVVIVMDWDRQGIIEVQHATVHSCGKKVMRLTFEGQNDYEKKNYDPSGRRGDYIIVRPDKVREAIREIHNKRGRSFIVTPEQTARYVKARVDELQMTGVRTESTYENAVRFFQGSE